MLSMCVLTLAGPSRCIDLVLLSTIFSIDISPKHHTNKDTLNSISSKYPCSGRSSSLEDAAEWKDEDGEGMGDEGGGLGLGLGIPLQRTASSMSMGSTEAAETYVNYVVVGCLGG